MLFIDFNVRSHHNDIIHIIHAMLNLQQQLTKMFVHNGYVHMFQGFRACLKLYLNLPKYSWNQQKWFHLDCQCHDKYVCI